MAEIEVRLLETDAELLVARQLHARRYLSAGFVDTLDPGGVIDDRWVEVSTYLGAFDVSGDIVGVVRIIPSTERGLPVTDDFVLMPEARAQLAGVPDAALAEVSALAVRDDASLSRVGYVAGSLYRAAVQHSVVVRGHTHWCAALDLRVKRHLMRRHGFLFEDLGPPRDYLGSPTVPVVLDLLGQVRHFALTAPDQNAFFLAGLVIDVRDKDVRLEAATGEFVPDSRHGQRDQGAIAS